MFFSARRTKREKTKGVKLQQISAEKLLRMTDSKKLISWFEYFSLKQKPVRESQTAQRTKNI